MKPYSPAEALALILEMNLTTRNYQKLRNQAIDKGVDLYPSYKKVKKMKKICEPKQIIYSDDEVKVSIKNTLEHQISRLFKLNPEIKEEMDNIAEKDPNTKFRFLYKYGEGAYQFLLSVSNSTY